jgi:hypothetical protein
MGSGHGRSAVQNTHEPRVLPADCKSALRGRFMGSGHGRSAVQNTHEPRVLPADCKSALRGRFMGSGHGLSSVHDAHEPCALALALALPPAGETKIKTKFKIKGSHRVMEGSQFHWNCILPMNLVFCAADCKSALRERFMESRGSVGRVATAATAAAATWTAGGRAAWAAGCGSGGRGAVAGGLRCGVGRARGGDRGGCHRGSLARRRIGWRRGSRLRRGRW